MKGPTEFGSDLFQAYSYSIPLLSLCKRASGFSQNMQNDYKNAEVVNDDILLGISVDNHPRTAGIESDLKTLILIS